ncbi:MAG: hypothetical protein JST12_19750 [Armatimonadetes bacterium]|nr:hypothetical protein [Armatimonadota bacterium]
MASTDIRYLENIVDYAGTFPPAALTASESYSNYKTYRAGRESWILGYLAWSCTNLSELARLSGGNDEVELALIGRPSDSWDAWLQAREQDVEDYNTAVDIAPNLVAATYESRIADLGRMTDALGVLKALSKEADIFVELPWNVPIDDALAEIASHEWARAKFRTGGAAKEAYPTPEQLATVIKGCVDLEIEFKLTAGLHEPIAHPDASNGAFAHGFLNILMATSMAYTDDATVREMAEVLSASDPSEWSVRDGLAFRGRVLGEDELDDARSFFTSFGSCSLDEPLQGLAGLRR